MPNPDVQSESLSPEQKLQQNLEHIQNEIRQLSEDSDPNNDTVEWIDWMLSTAFADYLRWIDSSVLNTLCTNVDSYARNSNDPNLKKLQQFLAPLINPVKNMDGSGLSASGQGGDIYNGRIGKIDNLDTTKTGLIGTIDDLLIRLDWGDSWLVTTLGNIKKVIEHPNSQDVKSLQQFLYNNLKWEAQANFLKYNFKNWSDGKKSSENPDWMFGQNLVDWINSFLDGLGDYVSQVAASREIQKSNDAVTNQPTTEVVTPSPTTEVVDSWGEQQWEFNKSLESIIGENVSLKEAMRMGDYSDIQKQINKVLEIERSKDLLEENKNLWNQIEGIEWNLKTDKEKLNTLKHDYELARDWWNSRKNLDWLRAKISEQKDIISGKEKEIRRLNRKIDNNNYTLSVEWSKNQRLAVGLDKFESKLKKKYRDLYVEKRKKNEEYQKSLNNISEWISESTKASMREENAKKLEVWNKQKNIFDKQLTAILEFGSWKINEQDWNIIDETDENKLSDYRKYANKINKDFSDELSTEVETPVPTTEVETPAPTTEVETPVPTTEVETPTV